jgi:hypothetical protein
MLSFAKLTLIGLLSLTLVMASGKDGKCMKSAKVGKRLTGSNRVVPKEHFGGRQEQCSQGIRSQGSKDCQGQQQAFFQSVSG